MLQKTPLLALAIACIPVRAHAQTLSVDNMTPYFGVPYTTNYTDYQPPGPAGTGLVWDYATLTSTMQFTSVYNAAAGNPYLSSFGSANMVSDEGDDWYSFVTYSAEGIDYNGMLNATYNVLAPYQDPKRLLAFPCSLGTTWQDNYGGPWISSTGASAHTYASISGVADATGTLIMPYGQLENVLRVSSIDNDSDYFQGFGHIKYHTVQQSFYKPGVAQAVLTISHTLAGGPAAPVELSDSSITWLSESSVGVQEAVQNTIGIDLLPNPAKGHATMVFGSQGGQLQLAIFDATGRTVLRQQLQHQPLGIAKHELQLGQLPAGLYTVQLTDANGQRGVKRLVVE